MIIVYTVKTAARVNISPWLSANLCEAVKIGRFYNIQSQSRNVNTFTRLINIVIQSYSLK
jgi:hypothetical protein